MRALFHSNNQEIIPDPAIIEICPACHFNYASLWFNLRGAEANKFSTQKLNILLLDVPGKINLEHSFDEQSKHFGRQLERY